MSFKVTTKGFKELSRDLKRLSGHQKKATQQALNRVGTTVRGTTSKEIAARMGGARMKDVKDSVRLLKASRRNPRARIIVEEKAIGLEKLRNETRVRKVRNQRAYEVSYKGKAVKGAFRIPELEGEGSKVLFRREGRKLKRLYGYTTYQEIERGGENSPVVNAMRKKIRERFSIEYDRALKKSLKRARFNAVKGRLRRSGF